MRSLTSTLTTAQKARQQEPYIKCTFSKTGETDVVVEQDRVLSYVRPTTDDTDRVTIVFQNSTGYFDALDFRGWNVVVQRGLKNAAGTVEYDSLPTFKVLDQDVLTAQGALRCTMTFIGIPDRLNLDKASKDYNNHWSNTKKVKALITEIASGVAVDTELTEEQTTTDDFLTLPISIGTTDTAGTVAATTAKNSRVLVVNNLGTGVINRGTTLTIAGDSTVYEVAFTATITANEATIALTEGLTAQALINAVVTLTIEAGTRALVGVALTIANRTVTKLSFKLKKVGSPTGNATVKITQATLNANGTVTVGSILESKTYDVSALTTSFAWVEITFTSTQLVNERVWLSIEYTGGTTANYICISTNSIVVKANEPLVNDALFEAAAAADGSWEDDFKACAYRYKYTAGTGVTNGVDCFTHCTAHTVTYDSEDSLIDAYLPAQGFRIHKGQSRLEAINTLLSFTKCVKRVGNDNAIHVLLPTTSGVVYDYQYTHAAGANHDFYSKSKRVSLIVPNRIVIDSWDSDDDDYSGAATDATSYALLPISHFIKATVTSNAQAQSIAEAAIAQLQMAGQRGSCLAPINLGAEIHDYCLVTDSWPVTSDTRTGNTGYLREWYIPGKGFRMVFSFGQYISKPIGGVHLPPEYKPLRKSWQEELSSDDEILRDETDDNVTALKERANEDAATLTYLLDKQKAADDTVDPVTAQSTAAQIAAGRKHAITSTADHTSTATSGQVLKANANGLPVDATNTDTEVADAVTKKHTQNTDTGLGTQGADVNMGTHKITNLVNGTAAQDAVAFTQLGRATVMTLDSEAIPTEDQAIQNGSGYVMVLEMRVILNVGGGYEGLGRIWVHSASDFTDIDPAAQAYLSNTVGNFTIIEHQTLTVVVPPAHYYKTNTNDYASVSHFRRYTFG